MSIGGYNFFLDRYRVLFFDWFKIRTYMNIIFLALAAPAQEARISLENRVVRFMSEPNFALRVSKRDKQ